jgi:hypothetical protein
MLLKLGALVLSVICLSLGTESTSRPTPKKRFANCTHAVAILGPGESGVDIRVDCWAPRKSDEFGFTLARLNSQGEARAPGIHG